MAPTFYARDWHGKFEWNLRENRDFQLTALADCRDCARRMFIDADSTTKPAPNGGRLREINFDIDLPNDYDLHWSELISINSKNRVHKMTFNGNVGWSVNDKKKMTIAGEYECMGAAGFTQSLTMTSPFDRFKQAKQTLAFKTTDSRREKKLEINWNGANRFAADMIDERTPTKTAFDINLASSYNPMRKLEFGFDCQTPTSESINCKLTSNVNDRYTLSASQMRDPNQFKYLHNVVIGDVMRNEAQLTMQVDRSTKKYLGDAQLKHNDANYKVGTYIICLTTVFIKNICKFAHFPNRE
jgi:hypothetical protein